VSEEEKNKPRFDISLPGLYKENWREAYCADKDAAPRLSSYQAPEGKPIPFIYKSLEFSGGQAVDTAEYPFFGLWSNEALNQKPQSITVHGYLRGNYYLQQRAAFVDALMSPTTDDNPGFFDHPLWGRFKVVVESYTVSEAADENGQCELTLTLKRAGVSLETRVAVLSPDNFTKPKEAAAAAEIDFTQTEKDPAILARAFGLIKAVLLNGIGRIQAAQTKLNSIANEINGISNLIAQGVLEPARLAQALINAVFSIIGEVASIGGSVETVKNYLFEKDNENAAVIQFLSAADFSLPIDTVTVTQAETKAETENLYRTVCLCASAETLIKMKGITRNKMNAYWAMYTRLENSVNLENPDVFEAVTEMRSTLSQTLRQSVMGIELKKTFERSVPLLYVSHYLKCDDEKLREMNFIEDSLLISGEVTYV